MATNKGVRAAFKTVKTDVEVVAMKRALKLLDKTYYLIVCGCK